MQFHRSLFLYEEPSLLARLSQIRIIGPIRDVRVQWDAGDRAFIVIPEAQNGLSGGGRCRGVLAFAGFEEAEQHHIHIATTGAKGRVIVCYRRDTIAHPFPAPFIVEPAPTRMDDDHQILRPTEPVALERHGATYHFPLETIGPAESWECCGYSFLAGADTLDFVEDQHDDDLLSVTVGCFLDLCECADDYIDAWSLLQRLPPSNVMSNLVPLDAELLAHIVADVCANCDASLPEWAQGRLRTVLADLQR